MIPLFKVFMHESAAENVKNTLTSGFITQGPKVEEFEEQLKNTFSYPYILTLNSGTSGLTLALRLIKDKYNLNDNTEVLTSPLTCMATNEPILANNMKIKWVDTDLNTCNMDLGDLKKKITHDTKVIMIVHWGGTPINLNKLEHILDHTEEKFGFRPQVIEDCAHSFMAEYENKMIGTFGYYSVFSLQAIKHLTTGDGGLIFLPNKEEYERAKLLRWYGIDRDRRNFNRKDLRLEHDVVDWGYKYHMNDINATIGLSNLPHIKELIEKNRKNAALYDTLFEKEPSVKIMKPNKNSKSAYWLYTIRVPNKEELILFLKENNIMSSQVHKRNDIHSCFNKFRATLSNLEQMESELLCIPVGWWVSESEILNISNKIKEFLHQ